MFLLPVEIISLRGQVKEKLPRPKESQKKLLRHSLSVLVSGTSRHSQIVCPMGRASIQGLGKVSEKSRYNPMSGMFSGRTEKLSTLSTREMTANQMKGTPLSIKHIRELLWAALAQIANNPSFICLSRSSFHFLSMHRITPVYNARGRCSTLQLLEMVIHGLPGRYAEALPAAPAS